MILPAALRVGPYRIRVKVRPGLEMDCNGAAGRFHAASALIELRADLGDRNNQDTLLHEALHAVLQSHGLTTMLDLDDDAEERLVAGLTPTLLALLRDNPQLVKTLCG